MIERYEVAEIKKIWEDHAKFAYYLQTELAILKTREKQGKVPAGTTEKIASTAKISPERIQEIEKTVKHDIIAFCQSITEQVPEEVGRYFHYGVTSSDVIDTATSLQLKDSLKVVISDLEKVVATAKNMADRYQQLLTLGRSHGIYAEPMSFGQKFLGAASEFKRRLQDYQNFYREELTGQFSGAVGNYVYISPQEEKEALALLELHPETVPTQVIPRDRIAKLVGIGGLLASAIERLATEWRLLHHSDVAEVHEGFSQGQKGSSIMPHKKNPISGENLTGISRYLRSHVVMALENCVLWHERDISHSSTERLYLPDHFGLVCYALRRLQSTLENMVIKEDFIEEKTQTYFTFLSSYFLHYLIDHTTYAREKLYPVVQQAAFKAQSLDDFKHQVEAQAQSNGLEIPSLPHIDHQKLKEIYLKNISEVYARF